MEKHHFEEKLPLGKCSLNIVIETGSVEVQPHKGQLIVIDAETRHTVLTVERDNHTVTVRAEREKATGDFAQKLGHTLEGEQPQAIVRVQVPAGCEVQARAVSGKLLIKDLDAPVTARVVTGQAQLENLTGPIYAKAVTGSVKYHGQLGQYEHRFETVTGHVRLSLTAEPDAQVDARTVTGNVRCDFPLSKEVERRHLTGSRLQGVLGTGVGHIMARVVTGGLHLEHDEQKA